MHQVQINIVQTQVLQAGLKTLFHLGVVRAPQLGGDEQLLALDNPGVNGLLDALADLVLVAVAQRSVDVAVADLDGVGDGSGDFARTGLPGAQAQSWDLGAGVELEADVCSGHFGDAVSDRRRIGFEGGLKEEEECIGRVKM